MAEAEDPWRERGRAVLVGLILALGVVAMVLLGRRTGGRGAGAVEEPAVAGVYDVVAACTGCGCEPAASEGTFAVVHPGLPIGRPAARTCDRLQSCQGLLQRRAPPAVRGPVVFPPDAAPESVAEELSFGPLLAPAGEAFRTTVTRRRQNEDACVRVQRTSELVPLADGSWQWVERYESAAAPECPSAEVLVCVAESRRRLRPRER